MAAATPEPRASSSRRKRAGIPTIPPTFIITLVPVCVALNIVGSFIVATLKLPVYLDMIGTAVAAILLGPWWGALVGILTNSGMALYQGPIALPLALVNITGALVWGYGVRKWALGRTIPRYFLLNILAALSCTIVAAPILVVLFGGATGSGVDAVTGTFVAMGSGLIASVLSANIVTSLADKIIGGFVALAIIEALPRSLSQEVDIVEATPLKGVLLAAGGVVLGVLIVVFFLALN